MFFLWPTEAFSVGGSLGLVISMGDEFSLERKKPPPGKNHLIQIQWFQQNCGKQLDAFDQRYDLKSFLNFEKSTQINLNFTV